MPEPAVVTLMRRFRRDLLAGERDQMQEMARRWLAVERALHGQMSALAYEMAERARNGAVVTHALVMQHDRYQSLLAQLTRELGEYTPFVERSVVDRQRQLAMLGLEHTDAAIQAQGVTGSFGRLPVRAVQNMVGMAGDGTPLRSLLAATWPEAAQGITQALVNGVALGYNPRKVARMMADGSANSLNRMMTIARTETLRVYRESTRQRYMSSGVVRGYKRVAAHDSRVCPSCLADDGHFYELNEVMPTHPSCRCAMVPAVINAPEPEWVAGEDWLQEQSEERQRSILGRSRFELWSSGQVRLADLVTVITNATWGDTLAVIPLREVAR